MFRITPLSLKIYLFYSSKRYVFEKPVKMVCHLFWEMSTSLHSRSQDEVIEIEQSSIFEMNDKR